MKWRVSGVVTLGVNMLVEADTREDALEKAHDAWPGMANFCGNGKRGGALCGPYQDGETDANIEADCVDDVQFTLAEKEE